MPETTFELNWPLSEQSRIEDLLATLNVLAAHLEEETMKRKGGQPAKAEPNEFFELLTDDVHARDAAQKAGYELGTREHELFVRGWKLGRHG